MIRLILREVNEMTTVEQLGNFPNTITNLDDKPNLSADAMKEALQHDVSELWNKCIELIAAFNDGETTPRAVAYGGTGGTTRDTARNGIGIYYGSTSPDSMAASLQTGDIYLYVPDLP